MSQPQPLTASGKLPTNQIFDWRPIVFMNKDLMNLKESEDQDDSNSADESADDDKDDDEDHQPMLKPKQQQQLGQEYFPLMSMEPFFHKLLSRFRETIDLIKPASAVSFNRKSFGEFIPLIHEITFLSKVLEKFLEVGFGKFCEIRLILNLFNQCLKKVKIILYGCKTEAVNRDMLSELTVNMNRIPQKTRFKPAIKLIRSITGVMSIVNQYRENLLVLINIKFFFQMGLRKQFSESITNTFLRNMNNYFEIFNFESFSKRTVNKLRVEEFPKLQAMFQQKLDIVDLSIRTQGEAKLGSLMTCIDLKMEDLSTDSNISLCSDLLDILVLALNPYYRGNTVDMTSVSSTLRLFNEAHYTKIIREKILTVIERFYLRGLTTLQKILQFEFVLEDKNLRGILDQLEVTPEEMNEFHDQIKLNIQSINHDDNEFMNKIKLLRREMIKYLKTKIYFPKVQKLSQISKWSEPCQTIISKMSRQLKTAQLDPQMSTNFEILRDFFVLQMMGSDVLVMANQEESRLPFLDVFMQKGARCDDILITIYLNLSTEVIMEDIKLLFARMAKNNIQHYFDENEKFEPEKLLGDSREVLRRCFKLNQYLNILRSFTRFYDKKDLKEFQRQILTNLLQSSFIKRLLDSSFTKNFVVTIQKHLEGDFQPIESVDDFDEVSLTLIYRRISDVFQNALELVFDCLRENSFAQLIYKSMTDYNDQMVINKFKMTPFCLKMHFYQMNFHSQFTTDAPQFKKVIDMLNSMINRDLFVLKHYFENKISQKNGEMIRRIQAFTKQKLKKSQNEEDDAEDEDDDDGADNSEEEEELDDKEEDSDSDQELPAEADENENIDQIWFREEEVGLFLNRRMRSGAYYGFLGFLVEFSTFLLINIEKYAKHLHQSENIWQTFQSHIKDLRNVIPRFSSFFCKESFCHAVILLNILDQNISIISEAIRNPKISILDPFEYKIIRSKLRKFHRPQSGQPDTTMHTRGHQEDVTSFNHKLVEQIMQDLPPKTTKDENFGVTLELLRYSLVALKTSFSERIKEIFESGIENMENRLVNSLISIVVDAKRVRLNHFITFDMLYECEFSYLHFTNFIRVIRQKEFDEGDFSLSQINSNNLGFKLDDYEVIITCIKLQKLIYGEKRWTSLGKNAPKKRGWSLLEANKHFNFLDQLNRKYIRGKTLKNFIVNKNFYVNYLECLQQNIFRIQKSKLENNNYIKKLSFELFGLKLKHFKQIFRRKKLDKCLSSRHNRFLLLHSIKQTVIEGMITFNPKNDPKISAKLQKSLSKRFVGLFALRMITSKKEDLVIKTEAMEVLYYLLVNGNESVQSYLFETIKENFDALSIVDCFEQILKIMHKKILKGLNKIERKKVKSNLVDGHQEAILSRFLELDHFEIMNKCLQLLQVFTENCYTRFQNLFREQTFGERKTNNNLIQHIINIIISLGKFVIFDKNRFNDETTQEDADDTESSLGSQTDEDTNTKLDVVGMDFDLTSVVVYKTENIQQRIELAEKGRKKDQLNNDEVEISEQENKKLKELIHLGFHFINDCMMGPNEENQKLINTNLGLINFACSVIRRIQFDKDTDLSQSLLGETDTYDFRIFGDAVSLLLYASNGNIKIGDMSIIFSKDNVDMFKDQAMSIYQNIIHHNRRKIISNHNCILVDMNSFQLEKELMDENECGSQTKEIRKVILNQHLKRSKTLMSTIRGISKKKDKTSILKKENKHGCTPWHCKEDWGQINMLYKGVIEAGHNLFILIKKYEESQKKEVEKDYTRYYDYYNGFYGMVEIVKDEKISIARYTKPYFTNFHYDKKNLQSEFKIEPYAEKIKNFMNRNIYYEELLSFRQRVYARNLILYFFIKNRGSLANLFYLNLLIINFLLLFDVSQSYDANFNVINRSMTNSYNFFRRHIQRVWLIIFYIGIFNSGLVFFIFILRMLDNQRNLYQLRQKRKIDKKRLAAISKRQKTFEKFRLRIRIWLASGFRLYFLGLFNFDNIYNLILIALSISALWIPLLYPFLLLDLIQRSAILKNIIKAISQNSSQLFNTMILTLIIMFIYASISFTYFADHFSHESGDEWKNYCYNLRTCFVSILNNGLRAGGGIGEALGQPTLSDSRFYLRTWLDISFMLLILIVLLNIVFGIIIDTFGDMRNERNAWKSYASNTCLICDLTKTEIDSEGEGYYRHINVSHSIEDYIYFMIYVKNKDLNDCDGIEQYVKRLSEDKNYSFMPNQESYYHQDEDF